MYATGAGDVCNCTELCPWWWGVQWRVWSEGWCSPNISTQPAALHHCAWSLITRVLLWGPKLQALGAQEMQWAQMLEKGSWLQMYRVPGNCTPLGWQTTEGSPGRTWQAWGGSFLLLPRRHALSSRWLWTFNHNTCENCLEEVQGSATSPLFTSPLFKNTWPCVQLLCVECNAPCQRNLVIDKAEPPASAEKWQGNDQTDLQCNGRKTLSPPGPMSYLCGLALRIWTSFWRREDSDGMDMWNAPMVQSRQPLTYRLMKSVGLGGPKWQGSSWQRGIAESGSSRLSTLMIDVPEDLVWFCHVCSKPAIWKGAHWCGCCPCTCTLIKNPIMIYDMQKFVFIA